MLRVSLREVGELKAALDAHAMVATTDPMGKITFVNDRFCRISKYSREELLGQDHRIVNSGYHPKDFIRELWTTIQGGHVWHGEIKNKAKDGSFYWVDTTIVPFLDAEGNPRQYLGIRSDITERKAGEATIRQLNADLEQRVKDRTSELEDANRELEAFSYSVSHDLRAPLRAIDGFSRAVLQDFGPALPDDGRRHLQRICAAADRMNLMIGAMLKFAQVTGKEPRRRAIRTEELVRAVADELGYPWRGRQVDLQVGELPWCFGDPVLLKQVWMNLLSNALKYTRTRERARIEIGCCQTDSVDTFFVRDNGIGFDPSLADELFGVFQRLHGAEEFEGSGIGLAIVRRIVQRHHGRVWAEAEVDRGATFYLTLGEESAP